MKDFDPKIIDGSFNLEAIQELSSFTFAGLSKLKYLNWGEMYFTMSDSVEHEHEHESITKRTSSVNHVRFAGP